MTFHCVFQWYGAFFAAADAFQRAFAQIQVLDIFQVFEDGFADVIGFGAPGAPVELFQSFFDGQRKSNGQHNYRYTSIAYSCSVGPEGRGARRIR